MTTSAKVPPTADRLRDIRAFAERIPCESASDRWLRAALCEVIGAILGDGYSHPDTELSGHWYPPAVMPSPVDASSRGQMRLQPAQPAAQVQRLQPAAAAPATPATPAAPVASNGARAAVPAGGMTIEEAIRRANERKAALAAAAPPPAPIVSIAPSNDPEPAAAPAAAAAAAAAVEAAPLPLPVAEPAPDPTVPDPAGPDFLARLTAQVNAESQ
jgi:hypothetical protein